MCFSFERDNGFSFDSMLWREKSEVVFLTISTLDKGEAARDYIISCMNAGIPVITCEKGSLSYHAVMLKPYLKNIGYSAAVGGGTMILGYVKSRHLEDRQVSISAVLNGL